ncbi:MAG: RluA family pseudouridine synthase [Acidobacteriota bacterium]
MHDFKAGPERYRLDEFLANEMTDVSVTRLRRLIADGDVVVNGVRSLKGRRLEDGDRVQLNDVSIEPTSATPEPIALDVLFEDQDLICVNKPSGLLTHPSHSCKSGTLTNGLAHHFLTSAGHPIRAGLIHRLDRDTSGVMVIAKTLRAHRILAKAFRERRVGKRYVGLLSGRVKDDDITIIAPIGCDPTIWPHWRVLDSGRPAVTQCTVKCRYAAHTLVEFAPETGRTHQLRIHSALIGHPIVGDAIYGTDRDPLADTFGIHHHLLHANRLSFLHPTGGDEMTIEAPLPQTWRALLQGL